MREPVGRVLAADDDADIADLVEELLTDEGYIVTTLRDRDEESVRATVERLRPDCVLLDGDVPGNYGESWGDAAAWMTASPAPVPVIMFSADRRTTGEAWDDESERSQAAHFSSVLPKPFDLDELLRALRWLSASRRFGGEPTDRSTPWFRSCVRRSVSTPDPRHAGCTGGCDPG